MVDTLTQSWIRNEADVKAAANGCRFDLERACWTAWWIERYCRLYEGERAKEPLILRGAYSMPIDAILDEWESGGREKSFQRARDYADCFAAGEPCDWQYECVMRIFGWVHYSDDWGREVRRFRKGGVWVTKKSKKSPTLAAIGLYLMMGDGEEGQKVFFAAKDGTQAREIAGEHALQMVRASQELNSACAINLAKMRISYAETLSFLQPLSSGSSRSVEAKEGLNGSILIDETHVVDREYASTISRAGISRAEPLFLQFSTAGKDPDSYGKEEFDYGESNNQSGDDQSYFFAYYGADQSLTDEALAADPEGILRAANPAIDHTVHMSEIIADYHASKKDSRRFAKFKMYRLNLWLYSDNPWIASADWEACGSSFTEESLYGQPCGAGLDLGQVSDMTAFSLVFPEDMAAWSKAAKEAVDVPSIAEAPLTVKTDEEGKATNLVRSLELNVKVLTWYWLPDAVLDIRSIEAPYADWARDGYLRLTSTTTRNTVDQDAILADIREIIGNFNVKMFAYDDWYAEPIINELQRVDGFPKRCCYPFEQSIKMFAVPSMVFERLVVSGKLHHNNNPITTWQAKQVHVKEDPSGNIRPVKPKRDQKKKVDGITATIQALDAAMRLRHAGSVYERRGILTV